MNDQQHAFWTHYARTLADLLGLKDRAVFVEREPPTDADALAYIWCCSDTVSAHIYLSKEFMTQLSPERQRCVVAHELMHIHTTPYNDQVKWMLDHLPESALTAALPALVRTEVERLTDRLAYVVAPFLPLPLIEVKGYEYGVNHLDGRLVTVGAHVDTFEHRRFTTEPHPPAMNGARS